MGNVHPWLACNLPARNPLISSCLQLGIHQIPTNGMQKHVRVGNRPSLLGFCHIMVLIPVPKLAGIHGFVLLDLTQEFKVKTA